MTANDGDILSDDDLLFKGLIDRTQDQPLNVFLGSAISFQHFPSFDTIRRNICRSIFESVGLGEEGNAALASRKGEVLRAETIFEAIWLVLDKRANEPFQCLGRSINTQPTRAHLQLAALAREGFVTTIFTTNWDNYIAKAWELVDSTGGNVSTNTEVPELKLHGDLTLPSSIIATISQTFRQGRNRSFSDFRKAFKTGPCLVLGYSGLDADVREAIRQSETPFPIYWLCFDCEARNNVTELRNRVPGFKTLVPVRACDGNLELLLERFCDRVGIGYPNCPKGNPGASLSAELDAWTSTLPLRARYMLAARLFGALDRPLLAVCTARRAAQVKLDDGFAQSASVLLAKLLCDETGEFRAAAQVSAALIKQINGAPKPDIPILARAYDCAAGAAFNQSRLKSALSYSQRSLDLEGNNPEFLNTFGIILHNLNDFDGALKALYRSAMLSRRRGRYFTFLDALNFYTISLSEIVSQRTLSIREVRQHYTKLVKARERLEDTARLYGISYYESCALINSAEQVHLEGHLDLAFERALASLKIDLEKKPNVPDVAVSFEILGRILIDVAAIFSRGPKYRYVLAMCEFMLNKGVSDGRCAPEEKGCLLGLLAVVCAETGRHSRAQLLMHRCSRVARKYRKVENNTWAHICAARIATIQRRYGNAWMFLGYALRRTKNSPFRMLYVLLQAAILSRLDPDCTAVHHTFELAAGDIEKRLGEKFVKPYRIVRNVSVIADISDPMTRRSELVKAMYGDHLSARLLKNYDSLRKVRALMD